MNLRYFNKLAIGLIVMLTSTIAFSTTVDNSIISTNNNFGNKMSATVFLDKGKFKVINNGKTQNFQIVIDDRKNKISEGLIVVDAPFCGYYTGFHCRVMMPKYCFAEVGKNQKIIVSGVISQYGLNPKSLRCFVVED